MAKKVEVAAFYFPQWHEDPQNNAKFGKGWSEWISLKKAEPLFPGHEQPKSPMWGYQDAADPKVIEQHIDIATDHGIDIFLYDWYWDWGATGQSNAGPYLQRPLEEGFLCARNRDKMKFALMWANHNTVDRARFDAMTDYIVEKYLHAGNHWRVNGGLFFSIYEVNTLVKGLGSVEATRDALESFRAKVKAAGLPPLHINGIEWGLRIDGFTLSGLIDYFGLDSATSYVWIHNLYPQALFPGQFPVMFEEWMKHAPALWEDLKERCGKVPYFPNVTMGWDMSPRVPDRPYDFNKYPLIAGNTPELFEKSLREAKAFVEKSDTTPPVVTLYAWNEWTEGGYLEPDTTHGMGYLEAIKRVFRA